MLPFGRGPRLWTRNRNFAEALDFDILVEVLTRYIDAAMRQAHYELMPEDEGFFGSIPGLQGVWGQGSTLEECRDELRSTLEDWLLFSLARQLPIPAIDDIDLAVREVA